MTDDPRFLDLSPGIAWDGTPIIWHGRTPRWTVTDLKTAIHAQCRACNNEERWHEGNDCVSHRCPLFPFRPGAPANPTVRGIPRALVSPARQEMGRQNAPKSILKRDGGLTKATNSPRKTPKAGKDKG